MTPHSPTRRDSAVRRLGAVPWDHDGYRRLTIWAKGDIPFFDDSMIRGALSRCAHACEGLNALDRALNRELWPLGYAASIEATTSDESTADVVITGSR
jgi:hypothetical protein